jgi:hypothetical protein
VAPLYREALKRNVSLDVASRFISLVEKLELLPGPELPGEAWVSKERLEKKRITKKLGYSPRHSVRRG